MTEYHNPKIPEGINVTDEHPLKGFLYLLAAVAGFVMLVAVVVSLSVGVLVKYIPFEAEVSLAKSVVTGLESLPNGEVSGDLSHDQQVTQYLQALADKLSQAQALEDEMSITVHYVNEPVVNALASLGGNIVIYQGIIDAVDSENALSMVMAHEIAHIKHRHPITAMGRGVTMALLLSAVTGFGDNGFAQNIVGQMSLFTALAFSRHQETQADVEAYQTLVEYYGHGRGATALFQYLQHQHEGISPPELLSTHPLSEKRIEKLKHLGETAATHCGELAPQCELTPLPAFLK